MQETGFSGCLGGFEEERKVLRTVAEDILPPGSKYSDHLDMMIERISFNPQWPWKYKIEAVQRAAGHLGRIATPEYTRKMEEALRELQGDIGGAAPAAAAPEARA